LAPPVDSPAAASAPAGVQAQARELDAILMALGRQILKENDPVGELPLRQFRVCMMLWAGSRAMSDLSRELGVTLSAMTQIANRLERAGMVTRGFEDTDRRVRQLQLTPRAQRMLRLRQESRVGRIATVLEQMEPVARAEALAALDALRSAAEASATIGNCQALAVPASK
jgi:DNA-binding MarR family transcriptional regulator